MKIKLNSSKILWMLILCTSCTKDPIPNAAYSNQITVNLSMPIVIDQISANLTATLDADVRTIIIQKGFCYSTTKTPSILSSKIEFGYGNTPFSVYLKGLLPGTMYYAKAFIITGLDTVYSDVQTFSTLSYSLPAVSSTAISNVSLRSATVTYTVSLLGAGTISSRGTCWSTIGTPTISNARTIEGSGPGTFSSSLSILLPNTIYYIRSYAINQAGTAYGNLMQFKTLDFMLPTVGSTTIYSITKTSAIGSSIVSSDGGDVLAEKGICWNTSPSPSILNNRLVSGKDVGSFTSQLTGLATGVTYYVRAYATNSKGTSYGTQVVFKTL